MVSVALAGPGFVARARHWRRALGDAGVALDADQIETLAARFRLTRSRIGDSVAAARGMVAWRETSGAERAASAPTVAELLAAARAQSAGVLAGLAQRISPRRGWADLVIPEDGAAQLRELCDRVAWNHRVFDDWGFDGKLAHGRGVNALFTGPSGTGKTTAAEVIAGELGLDLYRIDLAGIVSKYIGETEKNLNRVFEAAADANAVLLFDEADALFGKRSEVRDSHDRYANVEISYLLQKIEQYEGVAILATNLRAHIDEAFTRRLAFTVHFPFPDDAARRVLWERVWPAGVPMAADVDLDAMASRFQLSGGNIKNVALAAAFLAASNGGRVTMDHLLLATRREYQKLGKYLHDEALRGEEENG
jgi:hypothetical protein